MFGDVGMGLLGFHALADLNPLRWSGSRTIPKAIEELRKVQEHGDRPIILKIPPGMLAKELKFDGVVEAVKHLQTLQATSQPSTERQVGTMKPRVAALRAPVPVASSPPSSMRDIPGRNAPASMAGVLVSPRPGVSSNQAGGYAFVGGSRTSGPLVTSAPARARRQASDSPNRGRDALYGQGVSQRRAFC
jgi:hypothetical protein